MTNGNIYILLDGQAAFKALDSSDHLYIWDCGIPLWYRGKVKGKTVPVLN
jgi:hypothetical protein